MKEKKEETNFVNVICPKCKGNRFMNKNRPCNKCNCTGSILIDKNAFEKITKDKKVVVQEMVRRGGEKIEVQIPVKESYVDEGSDSLEN